MGAGVMGILPAGVADILAAGVMGILPAGALVIRMLNDEARMALNDE